MGRKDVKTRIHPSCEACGKEIDDDVVTCPCGAERPADGWPRVAQLRVFTGTRPRVDEEAETLVAPTPLRPPPRDATPEPASASVASVVATPAEPPVDVPPAPVAEAPADAPRRRAPAPPSATRVTLRLVAVASLTFLLTVTVVLGAWFGWLRPDRSAAQVVVAAPEPTVVYVPVPAPPTALATSDDALDAATALDDATAGDASDDDAPIADAPVAEPPAAPSSPRAAPRRVAASPPAEPSATPEEGVAPEEAVPTVVPVVRAPAPPPAPRVPDAVAGYAGTYAGKAQGRPLSLSLDFRPGDVLVATLVASEGAESRTVTASGTWALSADGTLTVAFVETDGDAPRTYIGTVDDGGVSGRVLSGGRVRGRFHVAR